MKKLIELTMIGLAALAADYCKTKIQGSYDFPEDNKKQNKDSKSNN